MKLLYVSRAKYEEDWHSTLHMHPFTELFYVVNGTGLFKIKDRAFPVEADDLVIVNPNLLHTESSKDSNPLEYIVLGIDGISLKPLEGKGLLSEYTKQNYRMYRGELLFYLNNILKEAEMKKEHYEIICHNLLEVFILNLTRRSKTNLLLSSDGTAHKDCAYIKNYIDIHYASDLDLPSLAAATYMNKYYLSHVFKKTFGVSPINYLINKRIAVAKFLLETTKYAVGEIGELVGYNSQAYFSQIFKKRVGLTPTEYRQLNQAVSSKEEK